MFNRRRLQCERLEVYLVRLILSYRPLILISGLLLLAYAGFIIFRSWLAGCLLLLPAIFLILLATSYNFVVHTARLGAWMATLWLPDE
jgi:hypothetical protein